MATTKSSKLLALNAADSGARFIARGLSAALNEQENTNAAASSNPVAIGFLINNRVLRRSIRVFSLLRRV
jgi:hypothetical protein